MEEEKRSNCFTLSVNKELTSPYSGKIFKFKFDAVFGPSASQTDLFRALTSTVRSAVMGDKVCLFGPWPTGSGKTYTILGSGKGNENMGDVPRSSIEICKMIKGKKK